MGIHDRDYAREKTAPRTSDGGYRQPGGGLMGFRFWSVTTWIIVACVAVFMIDAVLPTSWVAMSPERNPLSAVSLSEVDRSQWVIADDEVRMDPSGRVRTRRIDATVNGGYIRGIGEQDEISMHMLEKWLHFSTQRGFLEVQFWRLIGFQFLHSHDSIAHLLFNMIGLFVFGPIVEMYLGRKRYLAVYLICGIFGALMYVTLNLLGIIAALMWNVNEAPFLLIGNTSIPLIGASAGVYGVIFGAAAIAPREKVLLFGIIPMTIRMLAWLVFAIAFISIIRGSNNAGGEAAHIGGALAGAFFVRRVHLLHDFFDLLGRVDPTSDHFRGGQVASAGRRSSRRSNYDSRIDAILDKVKEQGVQSLTKKERQLLERNAKRD
jgi:membrane associated rhomboid family serine protease